MLFRPELAEKIAKGIKTETRRLVKAGEEFTCNEDAVLTVYEHGRVKYQVGRTYSVQYGMGRPTCLWNEKTEEIMPYQFYKDSLEKHDKDFLGIAKQMGWKPLRIRITNIIEGNHRGNHRGGDVRKIFSDESRAEGFSCPDEFLVTWANLYDTAIGAVWRTEANGEKVILWVDTDGTPYASDVISGDFSMWLSENRPSERYHAWTLQFKVVR